MPSDLTQLFWLTLSERGLDVRAPERLHGGRSNLVFRIGERVLKVYDPKRTNPLFANDPKREGLALSALSELALAPTLHDFGTAEGFDWILYEHIDGSHWQSDSGQVARLLSRVHGIQAPENLPNGPNGSSALAAQTLRILALCQTHFGIGELEPKGSVAPTIARALVHGDPVPANILCAGTTHYLIDWQCPVLGDPTEDLAIFLSPAMQFFYRGHALSDAEELLFLESYPDQSVVERYTQLKPWYHWRMAAYCAWRMQRGDPKDCAAMNLEIQKLKSLTM